MGGVEICWVVEVGVDGSTHFRVGSSAFSIMFGHPCRTFHRLEESDAINGGSGADGEGGGKWSVKAAQGSEGGRSKGKWRGGRLRAFDPIRARFTSSH